MAGPLPYMYDFLHGDVLDMTDGQYYAYTTLYLIITGLYSVLLVLCVCNIYEILFR